MVDNLATLICRLSVKSRILNLMEPYGSVQAYRGIALPSDHYRHPEQSYNYHVQCIKLLVLASLAFLLHGQRNSVTNSEHYRLFGVEVILPNTTRSMFHTLTKIRRCPLNGKIGGLHNRSGPFWNR